MIYRMKLQNEPFKQIKKGTKEIEIRLNDEKRKFFEINDHIEFINITTLEIMFVKITIYTILKILKIYLIILIIQL